MGANEKNLTYSMGIVVQIPGLKYITYYFYYEGPFQLYYVWKWHYLLCKTNTVLHRCHYQSTGFISVSLVKNTKQLICNSVQSPVNMDGKARYYKINGIAYASNLIVLECTEITS